MKEPIGTVGVICPADTPLLGFSPWSCPPSPWANTVIAIPSGEISLITGDLYQVFRDERLPGGVVNIVTGLDAGIDEQRSPSTMTSTPFGAFGMKPARLL